MLTIKIFEFNPLAENTYVVSDDTKECVIIDPGCFYPDEKKALLNYIEENNLTVKHILNTHLHFDHVFGVNLMKEQFDLRTHAHPEDAFLLDTLNEHMQMFGFNVADDAPIPEISTFLEEGDTVSFGTHTFDIFHVPGHSPGSIVFYEKNEQCVFVGDVLFNGSIGRTDLPRGNYQQLINGIKTKLFALPDETIVYPGHGPQTTIGQEKRTNPFLIDM